MKDQNIKQTNENILGYLDKSRAINITKPKWGAVSSSEESKVVDSNESDLSLAASSNSLNIKFYDNESSKDEESSGVSSYKIKTSSQSKNSDGENDNSFERDIHPEELKAEPIVKSKEKSKGNKKNKCSSPTKVAIFQRK